MRTFQKKNTDIVFSHLKDNIYCEFEPFTLNKLKEKKRKDKTRKKRRKNRRTT